jgi:anti-sigma factor RsiW
MNCRSAESLYSAFVEDELSQKERRDLETHLLGCRRCSQAVRELRGTIALTRSLPAAAVSEHFEEDVLARIRSGEALRPSLLDWLAGLLAPVRLRPVLAASAGICAVGVAAILFLRPSPLPPSVATATDVEVASPAAPAPPEAASPSAGALEHGAAVPVRTAEAPAAGAPLRPRRSEVQVIQSPLALEGSLATGDSARFQGRPLEPQYQDEYILDQFYIERTPVDRDPSMVPASGNPNDDVYITF